MISRKLLLTLVTFLAGAGSVDATAQTCAQPFIWTPGSGSAGGFPTVSDTTCGHETSIVSTCQSNFGAPGQAYVSLIHVVAAGTFTSIVFSGGSGYTLASYLVPQASGCGNFACTTTGDATTPMLHSDIGPGDYYLIVTGADFDAVGACGTFTMIANGFLPVALQAFSID
jgi:hypothetical protein